MKYINYYSSHSEYVNPTITPNISYCELEDEIHYNPHTFADEYFTTVARENGTISFNIWKSMGTDMITSISYSTDNGETWNTTNNTNNKSEHLVITVNVNEGDRIMWKGDATQFGFYDNNEDNEIGSFFDSDCEFDVQGNIMSLLYGDDFKDKITFESQYTFCKLFYNYIEDAGCMLVNAKNLLLPATTLTYHCYVYMFFYCTNLITAPELPAMTLANNCYGSMFEGCTNLTTAPSLPATTLADDCYACMFQNCTNLTAVAVLPATTLANSCYYAMFGGCTSLTIAPLLPATTLTNYCYHSMFRGCISLVTAPELPATTLANNCYSNMFANCTSLTTTPQLPAIILANSCYSNMFQGCTNLIIVSELPATTLTNYCYQFMFSSCRSLDSITCLATDISAIDCTTYWVNNVASNGTFIKAPSMNSWTTGTNGIPTGWTVKTANN